MTRTVEELLQAPYWIIDILPRQVPAGSAGQYFRVEEYFLRGPRLAAIKEKHCDLVLKLNCYRDVALGEAMSPNPPPEQIARAIRARPVFIMVGEAMIQSEPDDTYLTLYNADEPLLDLVRALAAGEGLYVWQPAG